jgi:uncharacterized protein YdcH (DUF465 family)
VKSQDCELPPEYRPGGQGRGCDKWHMTYDACFIMPIGLPFFRAKHALEVYSVVASENQSYQSYRLKGDKHAMDITTTDRLKEELMNQNPEFRELAREHTRYEQRLSELSALAYPSDEEQLEEITLKKKKLALKDQMYSMMSQYQKTQSLSH